MELKGREVVLREFGGEDRERRGSWESMNTFEEKFYNYPRLYNKIDRMEQEGGVINLAICDASGDLIGQIVLSDISSKSKTAQILTVLAPAQYDGEGASDALSVVAAYYVQAVPGGKLSADIPAFDRRLLRAYEKAGFAYRTARFEAVELNYSVPTHLQHFFTKQGLEDWARMVELVADEESVEKARATSGDSSGVGAEGEQA